MRGVIVILFLMFSLQLINAQGDTVVFLNNNFEFKDGIYLDFSQVRDNSPVLRSQIITDIDKDDVDFYEKLIKQDFIRFVDSGYTKVIQTNQIWGFCDEGTLYIHWTDDFAKILTKGYLGFFVATQKVTTYEDPFYMTSYYEDPYMQYPRTSQETRHFIIDFSTGKIYSFTPQNLMEILKQRDPELYQKYSKLSRHKKRKLIFYYLRQFNQRHHIPMKIKKSEL